MPSKHERMTSPVGIARWPRLSEPDTKFDKDGVYKVDLIVNGDDAKEMVSTIHRVLDTHMNEIKRQKPNWKKKVGNLPFTEEVDDQGNETGNMVFKFKLRAIGISGEDRWEQRPIVIDSQKTPMDMNEVRVGQGSKIRVGCEVVPYMSPMVGAGVSLRLKMVQVVELREASTSIDADWGFDVVEGFVTSEKKTTSESEAAGDDFDF